MTEVRTVWKDLESKRIRKSLEGVRVRSDVKRLWFLMVYTYTAEIKSMTSRDYGSSWCTHSMYIYSRD